MSGKESGLWHRRKKSKEVHNSEVTKRMGQADIVIEKALRTSNAKLLGLRTRNAPLGGTGPKPQFDTYARGGNAYPRRERREHPSGYHNCG